MRNLPPCRRSILLPLLPLLLLLLLLLLASAGFAEEEAAEVTYLANEGFLLQVGETRVLVDALFGDGLAGYEAVPKEIRRQLEEATGPFADVDLVLASHDHRDHFDPRAVARHLAANPKVRFVSTRQAVERLREEAPDFEKIRDRVAGFWPGEGEPAAYSHAGIRLTIFALHHGRERRPPTENLGFAIDVGTARLLHVGDTEATLDDVRSYELGGLGIDVALLPSWYFASARFRPVIEEIGARYNVAMHLAKRGAPAGYFGETRDRDGLEKTIREVDPRAWIPERPLAMRRFP